MKPTLQLRLSQHLALTPQLQQSIRLLQLSTLELNQEIEGMLLENPMLERDGPEEEGDYSNETSGATELNGSADASTYESNLVQQPDSSAPSGDDDFEAAPASDLHETISEAYDQSSDDDLGEAGEWRSEAGTGSGSNNGDDDNDFQERQSVSVSLHEHLISQISLLPLSDRDRALVLLIIEALDDDGYLTQPLDELMPMLSEDWEIDPDELMIALRHVQFLDPLGVGARNLQECLALQLKQQAPGAIRDVALAIVDGNLDLLAARDFIKLRRRVGCSEDALRCAQELICSLNPRPGAQFSPLEARYIVPDVIVRKYRGEWTATLNPEAMPKLRIHRVYADILHNNRGVSGSLSGQLQEAKWLIKNVQQRFDTIQRVSQAIVERQRQFFDYGEVAMRPLTLREIAEELELHESTISRVTTQKYMATARGIFELKYFFGSHVSTDSGGACSATAIRALIRQLVGAEDGKKPLSDAKIAEILGQQGIVVARRTIAKYRESLNIPPVSQRKTI